MMKKRFIAAVAGVMAVLMMLTGCNNKPNETKTSVDLAQFSETNGLKLPFANGEEIEIMLPSSVAELGNKLFTKTLEEITGVKIKYTIIGSANYQKRLKMTMASKQMPDVFVMSADRNDFEMLAQNDMLYNFSEAADKLPNIKEMFVDNPDNLALAGASMANGDLYAVPSYNIARDINHSFMYREDVFNKLGIKPWTNTEEFYQALKKLKEAYPDSYPFASKLKTQLIGRLSSGWGFDNMRVSLYKGEGDYVYVGTHPEMRSLLDFLHKLYKEELLDPEFLTCTEASWASKLTQEGKSFVTFDWVDRMDLFYEQVKAKNPDFKLSLGYPIGPVGKYTRNSKVGSYALAVSNNSKKEISAKLVDFLMSPAGAKLATYGVEGVSYNMNGDKVEYIMSDGVVPSIKTLEEAYGLFSSGVALRYDPKCVYYQFTPQVQKAQDLVVENNLLTEKSPADLIVKSDLSSEYSAILAELDTKFSEFASKYIVGETSECEKKWNDWVAQAKSLGAERLVEIANTK